MPDQRPNCKIIKTADRRQDNPVDNGKDGSVSYESRRQRPPAVPIKDADYKSLGLRYNSAVGQQESLMNEFLRRMQMFDERITALESK